MLIRTVTTISSASTTTPPRKERSTANCSVGLPSKALTRSVLGISETGIVCGDTEATLTGELYDGTQVAGTDTVNTVGCKGNGNSAEKADETSSSAGAMNWMLLLVLGVLGVLRQNRQH